MERNEQNIITDQKGELHNMVEEASKHGYTIKVLEVDNNKKLCYDQKVNKK